MQKTKQELSALLDTCNDLLEDFSVKGDITHCPWHYESYTLNRQQVVAVGLLLHKAKKLEQENSELKQMLLGLQDDVDRSIRYLDPQR